MRCETSYFDSGEKTIYEYDEQNKLISVKDYNSDGIISLIVSYTYDQYDNNIERRVTDSANKQIRRLVFKFDGNGNEIEYREYDRNDLLEFTCQFTYGLHPHKRLVKIIDKEGNLKEEKFEDN